MAGTPDPPLITVTVTATPDPDPGLPLAQRLQSSIARFQMHEKQIMQRLRVAIPAVVVDFQPGPPATVSVQVALKEPVQMNVSTATVGPPNVKVVPVIPGNVLTSIPVAFPTAGGWSITFPIKKGDECLLVFADACLDSWWQSGGIQYPISYRRHALSDAIAICGLRSTPTGLAGYATDSMQIRNDDQSVVIELTNAGAINIMASGNIAVSASGDVDVKATGDVNVSASGDVSIEGDTVAIRSTSGQTSIDGTPFMPHTHSGVQSGGSETGPVV